MIICKKMLMLSNTKNMLHFLLKGSSKARNTQILCHGMFWFFVQGKIVVN